MMTSPQVAAVIPTHARRERLPVLLDAVLAEPFSEVVVVVNGGDDGSMAVLETRSKADPRLKPIEVEIAGKPLAVQRGIAQAHSDVVLILDDDVLPRPGLAAGHARWHAERPRLVIVGYMPVARRPPRRPGEFGTELYSRAYERVCTEYESDPSRTLTSLWGGNVSLRREDALRVEYRGDGFEGAEAWRHEDRAFGLRCKEAGLEGIFDRSLAAEHRHQVSPKQFRITMRASGRERWIIHTKYTDTLGPLPQDFYIREVKQPGRMLLRISRRRGGHRPVRGLLRAIAATAGAVRLFPIETHAGWLLGMVEQQRGTGEAARETGGAAGE